MKRVSWVLGGVCAGESHHMEGAVFHPDPPDKPPGWFLRLRLDIEHQTADRAEEFAVRILKIVVIGAEVFLIDYRDLGKASRRQPRLLRSFQELENIRAERFIRVETLVVYAAAEFGIAHKVRVAADHLRAVLLARTQILNVGLNQ